MKFGMRKPSIKRSISARTTGKMKRTIKKTFNPLYGKKGMGYINNPKKAVYNKVYNKTTFSLKDVLKPRSKNTNSKSSGRFRASLPVILLVVGLFTLPVGLIFIAVGAFQLVAKRKYNHPDDASQEGSADTPVSNYSSPTPTPSEDVPKKKTESHHVAGISFREEDVKDLMGENAAYGFTKKELVDEGYIGERVYKMEPYYGAADLEPEPDNPHDPKAIKVMTAGTHIGYIKAGSCAHIHNLLRGDLIEKAEVEIKGGAYRIVLEDYDDYTEKSTYSLERGTIPIHAVLTLTLK